MVINYSLSQNSESLKKATEPPENPAPAEKRGANLPKPVHNGLIGKEPCKDRLGSPGGGGGGGAAGEISNGGFLKRTQGLARGPGTSAGLPGALPEPPQSRAPQDPRKPLTRGEVDVTPTDRPHSPGPPR